MRLVVVTGYLPLNVRHRSQQEYTQLGAQLFAAGLPTVAFLDPAVELQTPANVQRVAATLDSCWYRELLSPDVRNPVGDNDKKDIFDYYTVEHQKVTWVRDALAQTDADVALWVDFGLFHLGDFSGELRSMAERIQNAKPDQIVMPTIRPLPDGPFDYSVPQWFCAGGVFAAPKNLAAWFDEQTRAAARAIVDETRMATWEVNTWARVMQTHPEKFQTYTANHDVTMFTGYQPAPVIKPVATPSAVKIAVYALARNEEQHAGPWAESCREADYRVVTDTGSTDRTPEILRTAGVTVCSGNVMPWRWDDAHNLSLHHVPSDADICIRLDLDERLQPGWRDALLKVWTPGMTSMRYWYAWSLDENGKPLIRFQSDRVHARSGYRWIGATHEGLVCWSGNELAGFSGDFSIHHHRAPDKKHSTDLELLQRAVQENPTDARMQWYLARQLHSAQSPKAREAFEKYLDMPGGSKTERSFACRLLAALAPDQESFYLHKAIAESPAEPDNYYELAKRAYTRKDYLSGLYWATRAAACSPNAQNHTSDLAAYGHLPADIAAMSAFQLGLFSVASHYADMALSRKPDDERLQKNAIKMRDRLAEKN